MIRLSALTHDGNIRLNDSGRKLREQYRHELMTVTEGYMTVEESYVSNTVMNASADEGFSWCNQWNSAPAVRTRLLVWAS